MSDCKTCKNCHHAGKPDEYGWLHCARINRDYDDPSKNGKPLAVVTGEHGYEAEFSVMPDFGCVLWEAKSDE
jgi:hypothetical protein